jgi:hypothetical protein
VQLWLRVQVPSEDPSAAVVGEHVANGLQHGNWEEHPDLFKSTQNTISSHWEK